jgi:hypothetical protein
MQKSLLLIFLFLFFLSSDSFSRGGGSVGGGGGGGGGGGYGGGHYYHGYYYYGHGGHRSDFDPVVTTVVIVLTILFFAVALTGVLFLNVIRSKAAKKHLLKAASADAFWDEEKMKQHASEVFHKVQEAWSANDLSSIFHLVTNDFFVHNQHFLSRYSKMNLKNKVSDVEISSLRIVKVTDKDDNNKDGFVVYITGSLIDYLVNTKTGIIIDGDSKSKGPFEDIYVFFRRNNQWLLNQIINDPGHFYMREVKANHGEKTSSGGTNKTDGHLL